MKQSVSAADVKGALWRRTSPSIAPVITTWRGTDCVKVGLRGRGGGGGSMRVVVVMTLAARRRATGRELVDGRVLGVLCSFASVHQCYREGLC